MKLNDEQKLKVEKYLSEKWPEPQACVVCHNVDWKFPDELFSLTEYNPEYPQPERRALPVIVLICTHCGNTMLFYAKCMGIINGVE